MAGRDCERARRNSAVVARGDGGAEPFVEDGEEGNSGRGRRDGFDLRGLASAPSTRLPEEEEGRPRRLHLMAFGNFIVNWSDGQ